MRWFLILSLICATASAWEVDNVTCRGKKLKDSKELINEEVNKRIDKALDDNAHPSDENNPRPESKSSGGCSPEIYQRLRAALASDWFGNMETWAEDNSAVEKCKPPSTNHVYSKFNFLDAKVMKLAGLGSVININGDHIGADKLSHFMTEGYDYYSQFKGSYGDAMGNHLNDAEAIQPLLQVGDREESGIYGLTTTGVYSYADAAADYKGFTFWYDLTNGKNPFLKCVDGKWQRVRDFKIEEYTSPLLDESVNCNKYKTPGMQTNVDEYTKNLYDGKVCPLDHAACKKIVATLKPPEVLNWIVHSSCKNVSDGAQAYQQTAESMK